MKTWAITYGYSKAILMVAHATANMVSQTLRRGDFMRTQTIGDLVCILAKDLKAIMDRELKIRNMGFGQFKTLMLIKQYAVDGKIKQEQVAEKMHIDKSNVSRNIAKLRENRYIELQADEINEKKKDIILTDFANNEIDELILIFQDNSKKLTKGISESQLEIAKDCLEKMAKNIKETL